MSFAKNIKCSNKAISIVKSFLDSAKNSVPDAIKVASKRGIQKAAEVTGDF